MDTAKLPFGVLWHIDFIFFNGTLIRGLASALVIVELSERFLFFFPCRHKNPPIDLCLYFFSWLKQQDVKLPTLLYRQREYRLDLRSRLTIII